VDQGTRRRREKALLAVLRQLRDEKRMVQSELAARLGVPQSFISKYETGERRLDLADLHAIADALELTLIEVVRHYLRALGTLDR
jgi:transcriptional regulator with XRE-family HTH domain